MTQSRLLPFGEALWIVEGPTVSVAGFPYPTRMAVMRLAGEGLFIWSPTALTPQLREAVDALGRVGVIVAPNGLHDLYIEEWKSAYPQAVLFGAPGLAKKRTDIAFDGELSDGPDPLWAGYLDQVLMEGNLITTEVVFFHRASGTVLFTDLLQNLQPDSLSGWRLIVAKMDGLVEDKPRVPQKFRTAFVNRHKARAALMRIRSWPADKVLMAHGTPIGEDAQGFLARAFAWLG